jgi:CheY-like chemotaxis protein
MMNTPTISRPVRVLVADDNADSADTLTTLVRLCGADAKTCYDGLSALAAAEAFRPDVCLLDLNMPGMNGDQLAVRIREVLPDCRVMFVAVTAMGTEEARRRTERAGFHQHFVKPVEPAHIMSVVTAAGRLAG